MLWWRAMRLGVEGAPGGSAWGRECERGEGEAAGDVVAPVESLES